MQKLKKREVGGGGGKFLWIFDVVVLHCVVVKKFFLRVKLKNYIYISNICITSSKNWKKNIRRIFNDIQSYIYIIEIKISLRLDVEKLYLHYFLHESKISSREKKKKKNVSQEFIESNWKSIFQGWKKNSPFRPNVPNTR